MAIAIDNGVIYTGISVFRPFARVRWQRGHTGVATISVAVLIGASGTSAVNPFAGVVGERFILYGMHVVRSQRYVGA